MGDKTQLLVMGFAARHRLRDIILGVGAATIMLNAIGVFMGNVISKLFPIQYISMAAGFFFLIFALLSIEGDSEEESKRTKGSAAALGSAFFLAELGDKTQLSAIAFSASNAENILAVFLGTTAGMLIADGIGLVCSKFIGKQINKKIMNVAAYLIFTVFGFKTLNECFYLFLPNGGGKILIAIAVFYVILSFLARKRVKRAELVI